MFTGPSSMQKYIDRTRCSTHSRGDIWWQVVRTGTARGRHQISPWECEEHLVLYLLYDIIPFWRSFSSYSTTKNTRIWWDFEAASVDNKFWACSVSFSKEELASPCLHVHASNWYNTVHIIHFFQEIHAHFVILKKKILEYQVQPLLYPT